MTESTLQTAYHEAKLAQGHRAVADLLAKYGATPANLDSVPANRVGACVADLYDLAYRDDREGQRAVPKTLDEIAPQAWAKFNSPPSMRKRGE